MAGNRSTIIQPQTTLFTDASGNHHRWANIFERDAKFVSVTDRVHRETHEGEGFGVCHIFVDVGSDDHADILIQTGASKELHFTFATTAEGKAYAYLYEDTEATSGAGLTPHNKLRASSETSDAAFSHTPGFASVPVLGTLLPCGLIPGGIGGNSVGATGGSGRQEIVLKINTNYLVRVTNKAGSAKDISITCSWYEEPPL
jgi:hypothetical protein